MQVQPLPLLSRYNPQGGSFYQFWIGIRCFWLGWSLLWRSPRLQVLGLIPVLLTVGLLAGLGYLSVTLTQQVLGLIPADLPVWLIQLAETLSTAVVLLVVTLFLFFPLATVISAPFRELLSAHTERLLTGSVQRSEEMKLGVVAVELFKLIAFQVVIVALSLGLGWVTAMVGNILTFLLLIHLASLDMVDPPLSRRGYLLGQKLGFLRRQQPMMAGFGLMTFLLLAVPVLNLLILPVASIGATVLVLAALKQATDPQENSVESQVLSN